jgi:hypothetical protein
MSALGMESTSKSCDRGYRMIESFQLTGFRCFETIALDGLTRVNIITGDNASGKSALIEALLIAAKGTPETLVTLDNIRGIQTGAPPIAGLPFIGFPALVPPIAFKGVWDHFFRARIVADNDGKQALFTEPRISMTYMDSTHTVKTLNIFFQESATEAANVITIPQMAGSQSITPLVMERVHPPDNTVSQFVTVGPQGQIQVQPRLPDYGPAILIFPANGVYSETDNMTWFSQLREAGKSERILALIKPYFPYIANLEILQPSGIQSLYAELYSGEIRRLSTVSAGLTKIVSILLGCSSIENGIVLIDEIENGLFYEKYQFFWSALYQIAQETKNQLFVTSHSKECLKALVPVVGDKVDDFCLLRTGRENGTCNVEHINGIAMTAALVGDNEIRGTTRGLTEHNA